MHFEYFQAFVILLFLASLCETQPRTNEAMQINLFSELFDLW